MYPNAQYWAGLRIPETLSLSRAAYLNLGGVDKLFLLKSEIIPSPGLGFFPEKNPRAHQNYMNENAVTVLVFKVVR